MTRGARRTRVFLALAVVSLAMTSLACAKGTRTTEPAPLHPPFDPGYAMADWGTTGPGLGNPAITRIELFFSRYDPIPATLRVSGEITAACEIGADEFWRVFDAVNRAIESRPRRDGGCMDGGPVEGFGCFSGDWGRGAQVQGCVDSAVQRAREAIQSLAFEHRNAWVVEAP